MSDRKYFGTDGIRGKVGENLINPEFVMKLGWAAGKVLAGSGTNKVIIGKDTRISGYMLESALESGLSAAGINIGLLGPMPTPAIAYLTKTFRSEAGIVISASHNPYYDNGIKFFSADGTKLDDDIELAIEAEMDKPMQCVASDKLGKAVRIADAAGRYIEFCKGNFPSNLSLKGLKIVVDCAHGATYHIAPNVLSELGAEVIEIGTEPDGLNINRKVGATSMKAIVDSVIKNKADLGFALDGDGDRIMLVDHHGNVIDGDQIVYIIARDALKSGKLNGGVVGTVMSNLGLEVALSTLGVPFERSKVGDRYVLELLRQKGWSIGGEGSGHVLNLDAASTGDGIVAGLQVLAAMINANMTLNELSRGMTKFPQTLINVRFNEGDTPLSAEAVNNSVLEAEAALGERGRVLLRKSGTEPLIRVMVEANDAADSRKWAEHIADAVRKATGQ
ncbi:MULTISPECIES: phosphoglucosamine mutase [Paraglaciecola]|jgi:phosphoglucosamine mutase|uniref:Phosphoglucosamine mutase n=4 Tax=Paraglaciecola TaxID=1621534 RepID=A0A857JIQ5_9ALTE|nr:MULTISPECIES: phosphoglucosamine mutase [Paraglaciecola]AEE23695.1 phosphoglucosamine mutase [Glaciecola sp. 4H-3-7+YE-5]MBN27312.1 phosphoglucosamine mutase [Alteromonadaceae bacterium]MDO6560006.1 phosphoglucosamine mutase [Paraglaciecola chathamensis]MDO6838445.1 phosphoglucosamine mutase [Paraglaciecola chathamensis]QHJ10837.1 Phosphoglucosamine mutase [Paraglaciecola mesophila]|tara:strand:- start:8317 stop:9660 length:1344 start_codon:yes stop_codon:yes gene_type:complete